MEGSEGVGEAGEYAGGGVSETRRRDTNTPTTETQKCLATLAVVLVCLSKPQNLKWRGQVKRITRCFIGGKPSNLPHSFIAADSSGQNKPQGEELTAACSESVTTL